VAAVAAAVVAVSTETLQHHLVAAVAETTLQHHLIAAAAVAETTLQHHLMGLNLLRQVLLHLVNRHFALLFQQTLKRLGFRVVVLLRQRKSATTTKRLTLVLRLVKVGRLQSFIRSSEECSMTSMEFLSMSETMSYTSLETREPRTNPTTLSGAIEALVGLSLVVKRLVASVSIDQKKKMLTILDMFS
jgi:hypothetical protein